MRIYCFEVDGQPDWSNGEPVAALDIRTRSTVFLYRSLDIDSDSVQAPASSIEANAAQTREHALSIFRKTSPSNSQSSSPVHLFSYGKYIGLSAPDREAAAPYLERLRAEGLFPTPPPPVPDRKLLCPRCGKPRPATQALCSACNKSRFGRRIAAVVLAALLLVLAVLGIRSCNQPAPPAAPTATISSTSQDAVRGQSVQLSWQANGATQVVIQPGIGSVALSGTRNEKMQATTTYTITATGPGGTATQQITINVHGLRRKPNSGETSAVTPPILQPMPDVHPSPKASTTQARPVVYLNATPGSIQRGQSADLSWGTAYATTATLTGVGTVATTGPLSVKPDTTTTYTLTASGPGGETSRSVTIVVTPPPAPQPPSVDSFGAESNSVAVGQHTALRWKVSGDFTSLEFKQYVTDTRQGCTAGERSITPAGFTPVAEGRLDFQPICTAQYTLLVRWADGTISSRPTSVQITRAPGTTFNVRPLAPSTSGDIEWVGQIDSSTRMATIAWNQVQEPKGYLWQAVNRPNGFIRGGGSVFDATGTTLPGAVFTSADASCKVTGSYFNAGRFEVFVQCGRSGHQIIHLHWATGQ